MAVGGKAGDRRPVHQPQAVGHDDVPIVGLHVPEGQGHVLDQPGKAAVAQGPDQHGRGLAAGDGVVGAEAAVLAGDGPLMIGGFQGSGVPGLLGHILIDGPGGGGGLPAHGAAQHHHELGPGHLLPHAEAAVAFGVEVAQGHTAVDVLLGPKILRHVGEGGGGCGEQARQQGAQQEAGEDPFSLFHIFQLLQGQRCLPILADFSPPVKRKLSRACPEAEFLEKSLDLEPAPSAMLEETKRRKEA